MKYIMSTNKGNKKWITIRVSEGLVRKLVAICKATGKTKTGVLIDLINTEYEKSTKYEKWYYADLEKKV